MKNNLGNSSMYMQTDCEEILYNPTVNSHASHFCLFRECTASVVLQAENKGRKQSIHYCKTCTIVIKHNNYNDRS